MTEDIFPTNWEELIHGVLYEVHYSITDAFGDAIVIEYTKDGRKVHNNTVHVVTNSPTYDFHMLNLRNYQHLIKLPTFELKVGNITMQPFGTGNVLQGIPGDRGSPSRFVRTAALLHLTETPETSDKAVNVAFHILNAIDIPKGKRICDINLKMGTK